MGVRRMTQTQFFAEHGFGQEHTTVSRHPLEVAPGPRSYPEFPVLNAKLQELYRYVDPAGPIAGDIVSQLEMARLYGSTPGNEEIAKGALFEANRRLDAALKEHAGQKRWLLIVALIVAVLGVAAIVYARRKKSPRRNVGTKSRRRRKRLPPPRKGSVDPYEDVDDDADEDADEDDDE